MLARKSCFHLFPIKFTETKKTNMDSNDLNSVIALLAQAGDAIVEVYDNSDLHTRLKADNTPVTIADKASSRILNQGLNTLFPNIPILDEETHIPDFEVRRQWSKYFLVDPLDGTREFIKHNGEFCINLALIKGTSPEYGWIYQPLAKIGWYCKRGEGIVEFNSQGKMRKIQPPKTEGKVIRIAASRSFFKPREAEIIEKIKRFYAVEIIHCGSSLKQVQMIKGNADMYMKAGPCSEWDTAPGQLMVEDFGGAVLRHDTFKTLEYNREVLINPYFVMLGERLNTPDFVDFLQQIIRE